MWSSHSITCGLKSKLPVFIKWSDRYPAVSTLSPSFIQNLSCEPGLKRNKCVIRDTLSFPHPHLLPQQILLRSPQALLWIPAATILLKGRHTFTYTSETQDLKVVIGKIIKTEKTVSHRSWCFIRLTPIRYSLHLRVPIEPQTHIRII